MGVRENESEVARKMFSRFRNLFAKSKADEVPIIVVDEAPPEEQAVAAEAAPQAAPEEAEAPLSNGAEVTPQPPLANEEKSPQAPLASEEEDLTLEPTEPLSASTQELSQLLDELNLNSKLPEITAAADEEEEEDDDTASTSSVKTKIAKASIERDIIIEETLEEEEDIEPEQELQPGLHSLDKIKALIRNDSETYPQSEYTDTSDAEATPSHSRTASLDSTADALSKLNPPTCDYSIVPDELPLDSPISPSPLHDSGRNSSTGSAAAAAGAESPPSTLSVTPTGNNELACAAISHKLNAIAEVAESLDAVIRDCGGGDLDVSSHKKLGSSEVSHQLGIECPLCLAHSLFLSFFAGLAVTLYGR